MKASRFSDAQKAFNLKQGGCRWLTSAARPASAKRPTSIGRRSTMAYFQRRCGGLMQLEDGNSKLRKVVADLSLDKEMLQDALRRKL